MPHRIEDPAARARVHGLTDPKGPLPLSDDNMNRDRLKNRPKKTEKELNIKQVPFRMHKNDYAVLRHILEDDGWKLQTVLTACVEAYMNRNPLITKVLADWKESEYIGRRLRDGYSLSHKERKGMLDEIESGSPLEEDEG